MNDSHDNDFNPNEETRDFVELAVDFIHAALLIYGAISAFFTVIAAIGYWSNK